MAIKIIKRKGYRRGKIYVRAHRQRYHCNAKQKYHRTARAYDKNYNNILADLEIDQIGGSAKPSFGLNDAASLINPAAAYMKTFNEVVNEPKRRKLEEKIMRQELRDNRIKKEILKENLEQERLKTRAMRKEVGGGWFG